MSEVVIPPNHFEDPQLFLGQLDKRYEELKTLANPDFIALIDADPTRAKQRWFTLCTCFPPGKYGEPEGILQIITDHIYDTVRDDDYDHFPTINWFSNDKITKIVGIPFYIPQINLKQEEYKQFIKTYYPSGSATDSIAFHIPMDEFSRKYLGSVPLKTMRLVVDSSSPDAFLALGAHEDAHACDPNNDDRSGIEGGLIKEMVALAAMNVRLNSIHQDRLPSDTFFVHEIMSGLQNGQSLTPEALQ